MDTLIKVAAVVGPLLMLLSLIAAYYYFRKSRKYMELTYELLPTLSLVSVGKAVRDKVEVKYDNEQIEDLEGVAVRIRNTGTEPVEFNQHVASHSVETQTPITLDFGEGARILGEPNIETSPKGLKIRPMKDPLDPGKVILDRFLLNPGEAATISVFLTNFTKDKPEVYAHLKGVPPLRERGPDRRTITRKAVFTLLPGGVALGGLSASLLSFFDSTTMWTYVGSIAGTVLAVTAVMLGVLIADRLVDDVRREKS